jgi:hypothetical protein
MRKLLLFLTIIFVTITIEAQQFKGVFAPVKEHPYFKSDLTADRNLNGIMLLRIGAGVTGMETTYNKTLKKLEQKTLIKAGGGVTYGHHKLLSDGTIYNDWSVNCFVLTPVDMPEPVSIAVTVSALEILQAGINLTPKYFKESDYFPISLIWGLSYTF